MLNDDQIKDIIVKKLEFDSRIDSFRIIVVVSGGHVRLTGTIPSLAQKRELSLIIWAIGSVKNISNQLEISSNPEQNFPADSEVLSNVKIAIKINSETSHIIPHVSVEDNIVNVSGAVDSLEKVKKVESIIGNLSGVKDVINLLTVVPTQAVKDVIIANALVESFKQNSVLSSTCNYPNNLSILGESTC